MSISVEVRFEKKANLLKNVWKNKKEKLSNYSEIFHRSLSEPSRSLR